MNFSPTDSNFDRDLDAAIEQSRRRRIEHLEQITEAAQSRYPGASWDDIQPHLAAAIVDAGLLEFTQIDQQRQLAHIR